MATAEAVIPLTGAPQEDGEKRRQELAMLEGHDADIPTEEQPIEVDNAYTAEDNLNARESSPSPTASDPEKLRDEEQGRISENGEGKDMEKEGAEPPDPNIVDWDGPDDPENPMNWNSGLKWGSVTTIAAITFITYVCYRELLESSVLLPIMSQWFQCDLKYSRKAFSKLPHPCVLCLTSLTSPDH